MAQAQQQYAIRRNGETKEFETQEQFHSTKSLLDQNGVDYEIVNAPEEEPETPDDPDVRPNGGADTKSDESGTEPVEVVDDVDAAESLPDRELTEDPIAWLQRGEGELTTEIKGTTVITKKGFRVLQHKYDISTGSDVLVGPEETGHEFARVKAWAEMPDGRRAEAHASAHTDRGDDHFLLTSLADTRAKSRALSDVTGVGAVALEEMLGVDPDD